VTATAPLNAAQQRVVELLGRPGEPVVFPAGLGAELRDHIEQALGPLSDALDPDRPLWVSKHLLTSVHGCEGLHCASQTTFAWSASTSRGAVAHRAIELSVAWAGEPAPLELVGEAIARLAESDVGMARYLQAMTDGDRAQLTVEANDLVAKFLECFPRLSPKWRPVAESRTYVELLGRRVVLAGKVDLTLGTGRPDAANKVIIDLKSGNPSPTHRPDLWFYALLETIKLGVPPRKVATYYLDAAQPEADDVTVGVLWAAAHRAVEGVRALVELRDGRAPVLRPGPPCRWCPVADSCARGREFLIASV